jgi:hypothetical protein
MGNKTIYLKPEDEAVVARAVKLLAVHEDKGLSASQADECRKIVQRYEPTDETRE